MAITDSQGYEHVKVDDLTLTTGDLEIGSVEIKNSTDDTRAVVGANGLYVDVRSVADNKTYIGLTTTTLGVGVKSIGLVTLNASNAWIGIVSTASINGDVNLQTLIAGEDQTNDVLKVEGQFSYTTHIANTTTLVKAAAGLLHLFNVGMPSCPTILLYDSLTPSGTILQRFAAGYPMGSHPLDVKFTTGLTIDTVTGGVLPQLLVSWR